MRSIRDFLKGISRVSDLTQKIDRMEYKIEQINDRLHDPIDYDCVRLGEALLFVPTNDNLYNLVIPLNAKGATKDTPVADMQPEVTKVMHRYLDILHAKGAHAHLLDIGSWVGDIAIRWAIHARRSNYPFTADCYDPSLAGRLIPFNTELNGVADMVRFDNRGVSVEGGPQLFRQFRGHSDSSRLSGTGEPDHGTVDCFPIHTITLAECLRLAPKDKHLIVKIDVEGIDAKLVVPNLAELQNATLAIEFAPNQKQYDSIGAAKFIKTLLQTHSLFDLWYLPRPTRSAFIEDAEAFTSDVASRVYGYTDILAVPKSGPAYDNIVSMLRATEAIEPSYLMT